MQDQQYLGQTLLSPAEYYQECSHMYANPHADGIRRLLGELAPSLSGNVLDLGCGDGLATKALSQANPSLRFMGVDRSIAMCQRYKSETGATAYQGTFVDRLPSSDAIIACYSLHLASPMENALIWWQLRQATSRVIVLSPFRNKPEPPKHYFVLSEDCSAAYGPKGKTIHAKIYQKI